MRFFKYVAWGWAMLMSLGIVVLIDDNEMDIYALMNLAYSWAVVWYISQEEK